MVCIGGPPLRREAPPILAGLSSNCLPLDSVSNRAPDPVRRGAPALPVRS